MSDTDEEINKYTILYNKYNKIKSNAKEWYMISKQLEIENNELKLKLEKNNELESNIQSERISFQELIKDKDLIINSLKESIKSNNESHKEQLNEIKYEYRERISDLKNDLRLKDGEIQSIKRQSKDTIKYWEELVRKLNNK